MKKILTYGTYDLITPGHIQHLRDAKAMGDYLVVGLSTDEFNAIKHKTSYLTYEERKFVLEAIKYVDEVIPERDWDQKPDDIKRLGIDIVVMGSDWKVMNALNIFVNSAMSNILNDHSLGHRLNFANILMIMLKI